MDTRLRTSFIPKKNLILKSEEKGVRVSFNLFLSLGMIVFFLMVATSGGIYFYKVLIQNKITEQGVTLEKAKKAFEPSFIAETERLDDRLIAAKSVLANHVVALPVFALLEELTLKTIRFTKLNYQNKKSEVPTIELEGVAQSYTSVALQSDSFAGDERIKNPIFSGVGLTDEGAVKFSFRSQINPALVSFKTNFEKGQSTKEE